MDVTQAWFALIYASGTTIMFQSGNMIFIGTCHDSAVVTGASS